MDTEGKWEGEHVDFPTIQIILFKCIFGFHLLESELGLARQLNFKLSETSSSFVKSRSKLKKMKPFQFAVLCLKELLDFDDKFSCNNSKMHLSAQLSPPKRSTPELPTSKDSGGLNRSSNCPPKTHKIPVIQNKSWSIVCRLPMRKLEVKKLMQNLAQRHH